MLESAALWIPGTIVRPKAKGLLKKKQNKKERGTGRPFVVALILFTLALVCRDKFTALEKRLYLGGLGHLDNCGRKGKGRQTESSPIECFYITFRQFFQQIDVSEQECTRVSE